MKIVSLNIRGLGGKEKFLSIKNYLFLCKPTFIFIQETMHTADSAILYFRTVYSDWHLAAIDVEGQSGGLVALWDPKWANMRAYSFFGGILLSGKCRGFKHRINFINMYAPYKERLIFWRRIEACGILSLQNILIAGDLNCVLHDSEIWGDKGRRDPLMEDIKKILRNSRSSDISFIDNCPTWLNGRKGGEFIGKVLDRFIVSNNLRLHMGNMIANVEDLIVSDHRPITLMWDFEERKCGIPFKFNRSWLTVDSFNLLI